MTAVLKPGSSISHYRVVSALGAGGMAEVYQAEDTTLERAVALKVLPLDLVNDRERMQRFVQEAKSASSLNHPHIVTVYEIGSAEVAGDDSAEPNGGPTPIHFISMELIDGDTLHSRIHQDKLELKLLLDSCAQAAEGIAKAHDSGIIHRDLKPENIMVSHDGYAKVLDFGLAKLQKAPQDQDPATADTAIKRGTQNGVVLGTVGYMSPEQVRGQAADHRTDIFSLGCVIYEAATRKKSFEAPSSIESMHRILHDQPTPVEELNPDVPVALRRLIRRCLNKNPERRYQSMRDLAIELRDLVDEWDELPVASSSSGTRLAPDMAKRSRSIRWVSAVVAVLVAAAIGTVAVREVGQESPPPPRSSFLDMKLTRLTSSGRVRDVAISPDAKYVAMAIEDPRGFSITVRQIATGSEVEIVPPQPNPFKGVVFSQDGNYVLYSRSETTQFRGYTSLYRVASLGGRPSRLLFDVDTAITFSPDGESIAFMRGIPQESASTLIVANADGSNERELARLVEPDEFMHITPAWSPSGNVIAAVVRWDDTKVEQSLVSVRVDDGAVNPIDVPPFEEIDGLNWLSDGSGLALSGRTVEQGATEQVYLVSYPDGARERITNDLNRYARIATTGDTETLATVQENVQSHLWITSLDSGKSKQITTSRDEAIYSVDWSHSDALTFRALRNGKNEMWTYDMETRREQRLPAVGEESWAARLSRDGNFVVFASARGGEPHIWKVDTDGSNPVQLTSGDGEWAFHLSPDGRVLYYLNSEGVWRTPLDGSNEPRQLVDSMGEWSVSPDGRFLLTIQLSEESSGERPEFMVHVNPAEGGDPVQTMVWEDRGVPGWGPNSDTLTYVMTEDGVSNLWSQSLEGGDPEQLTDFDSGRIFSYGWSADGNHLAVARGEVLGDVVLISNFR